MIGHMRESLTPTGEDGGPWPEVPGFPPVRGHGGSPGTDVSPPARSGFPCRTMMRKAVVWVSERGDSHRRASRWRPPFEGTADRGLWFPGVLCVIAVFTVRDRILPRQGE